MRFLRLLLSACVGAGGEATLPADESFLLCPQELEQLAEGAGSGLVARLTCKFRSALKAPNAPPSASSPHHPTDVERPSLAPSADLGPASDVCALADRNASSYAAVRCQCDPDLEEPLFWDAGTPQSGHDSDSDFSHQDDDEDGDGSSCASSLTADGDADEMWDELLLDHILQPLYSMGAARQQQQEQLLDTPATTVATAAAENATTRQLQDGDCAACSSGRCSSSQAEEPRSHCSSGCGLLGHDHDDEDGGDVSSAAGTPPRQTPCPAPAHDIPLLQARLLQELHRPPAPLHVRRGAHSKVQLTDVATAAAAAAHAGEPSLLKGPALALALDVVCHPVSSSWSLGSARDWGAACRAAHLSFYGSPTCPLHVWASPSGSGDPSPCASPAFRSRSSPNASSATAVAAAAAAASCCLELSRAGLPRMQLQMAALGHSLISCSH